MSYRTESMAGADSRVAVGSTKPESISLKVKVKAKAEGGAKIPPVQHIPRLLMSMAKSAGTAGKRKVRFGG